MFGSKAGSSAGARLWGFAESLPSNGEHLLPGFLVLTAAICMCLCSGGSEGGWGTREGINRIKQAAREIKAVFGFMVLSAGPSFLLKPRLSVV